MKKIILFLLLLFPINIYAIEINSKSAIVVNRENNEVLYEKNKDDKLLVASLTKIMTTIVALENINDLGELVEINSDDINVTSDYVTLGLEIGMKVSYKDLLFSTIINSSADSALTLANHIFDNYQLFIDKMNEKAKELGMNNTNFSNPIGFDENNYSSANDLYKLLDYALHNKNFYEIYTTNEYKVEVVDKKISNYVNKIIDKNEIDNKNNIRFLGTKTGFTTLSGMSLSGISEIDNIEILIITIGAIGNQEERLHIVDSINLLNYINDNYSDIVLVNKDFLVDNIIYKSGKKNINYEIRTNDEIKRYVSNDFDLKYLKVIYDGKVNLDKNIKHNEKIGEIKVFYQDKLLESKDVFFDKIYIIKETKNYKKILIVIGVIIFGLFIFKKTKK